MCGLSTLGMDSFRIMRLLGERRRDESREGIETPYGALHEPSWGWVQSWSAIYIGFQRPQKGPLGVSMRTRVKQPVNRKEPSWGKCTGQERLSSSVFKKMFYMLENYNLEGDLLLNLFLTALLKILYH